MRAWCGSSAGYGLGLVGGESCFRIASLVGAEGGGVVEHVKGIKRRFDLGGNDMTTFDEDVTKLVGDHRGRGAREDGADWTVEIEEKRVGCCQQSVEGGGVVNRGHGVNSALTVFHMLSNQVRACSTYWLPVLVSSSVVEWWKRMASLPIRS